MVWVDKGSHWLVMSNVISRKNFLIWPRSNTRSNSQMYWHRWRNWNRFRTDFLGGIRIDSNRFEQALALPLMKSGLQVWSHIFFFFFLLANNRGHYLVNPYFWLATGKWRRWRQRRGWSWWRIWICRRWSLCPLDRLSNRFLHLFSGRPDSGTGRRTTNNRNLP